jgi:pilus assembly protein Flp/PilA
MPQKGSFAMTALRRFMKDETGATAIEYGLIASLIALAIVAGVSAFADSLEQLWYGNNSKIAQGLASH